jgi:hypothetical protein
MKAGARSQLWGSWSQSAPGPRYRVTGTAATFVLASGDTQEDHLVVGESPASLGDSWGVEPAANQGTLHVGAESRTQPSERGRWDEFYPAFAGAVRGANAAPVEARDAVDTAIVLDAAQASAASGDVVRINPGSLL